MIDSNNTPPIVLRVVISASGKELELQTSTCQRIVNGNGTVTELVALNGCRSQITDQELDHFVAGFTSLQRDNQNIGSKALSSHRIRTISTD